jgi:two-component system response regulator WspF
VSGPLSRPAAPTRDHLPPLVVVGASTGGPEALRKILAALPGPLDFAMIVVQHLGELFVPGLASWLAKETGLDVSVIVAGWKPIAGQVAIACTSDHVILDRAGKLVYVREPEKSVHRPSVDVFFASLLTSPAEPGTAVLLTGMGDDGAEGLKALHDAGWATIIQDEATSVVWGMPRAALKRGAADQTLPVEKIGEAILRSRKKGSS